MLSFLKGVGYVLLAILVLGIIGSAGAIFATIGAVISIVFIGVIVIGFVAMLIKQALNTKD